MTPEFWTLLGVIVLQLAGMYNNYRAQKAQEPLVEAQAESAIGDAMEKLGQEYSRMLGTNKALEEELSSLRPLTLKIALQEQTLKQAEDDKADWKRYAERLARQLEEHEILPIPFRRYPSNGDSQKTKAVPRDTKDKMKPVEVQK